MMTQDDDDHPQDEDEKNLKTTTTATTMDDTTGTATTDEEEHAAPDAKQTLKDLINVTNFEDGQGKDDDDEDAEVEDEGVDNNTATANTPFLLHQTKAVLDDTVQSIRGNLEEHVSPKVQAFVQETQQNLTKLGDSVRGVHQTHVVPHINKAGQGLQEFGQNTQKALGEFGEKSKSTMNELGSNTKKAMDAHVVPHIQNVQQRSARAMQHVGDSTKAFHQQHVEPKAVAAGQAVQTTYAAGTGYVYNHRHYFWNSAPALACDDDDDDTTKWYRLLEEATLRAFGQVVYCNNPISGLCIWWAILWASPLAGVCSLVSVLVVHLTCLYLDMDRDILRQGLYGFNAVLVGTALVDYFEFDFVSGNDDSGSSQKWHGWILSIFLSVVLAPLTVLVKVYLQHNIFQNPSTPVLLLPFNLVMMVVLLSAKVWDSTMLSQVELADQGLVDVGLDGTSTTTRYFGYQALFNGLSRIFLVDGIGPGVLILVGVFMCSRILAASLVAGAFGASLVGLAVFGDHTAYLNAGYCGFNPALAVSGIFFFMVPSWKLTGVGFFWIFVTMIVTVAFNVLLDAL